ncbi:hypothetical protein CP969_28430 [Streptomyces viridosporus T7A]|uniref:Uncharacterized protein n=1 Tax=Streptomyces viridosporus T7A TaxID=665577 RepID=A0ABX6AJZ4_STRVD|nr:hypothetical protein CP969_28430 [Streptomyces viridosporus T7A]
MLLRAPPRRRPGGACGQPPERLHRAGPVRPCAPRRGGRGGQGPGAGLLERPSPPGAGPPRSAAPQANAPGDRGRRAGGLLQDGRRLGHGGGVLGGAHACLLMRASCPGEEGRGAERTCGLPPGGDERGGGVVAGRHAGAACTHHRQGRGGRDAA